MKKRSCPEVEVMEIVKVRKEFPILETRCGDNPLVYLDNAATTQVPCCVLQRYTDHYARDNANIHRGTHCLSRRATREYENARTLAAKFIDAESPDCIVFTSGTTGAINTVARAWCAQRLSARSRVITTVMEHHSNYMPWLALCEKYGAKLVELPLDSESGIDMTALVRALDEGAELLAITHVSNVLSTVNPIREITEEAHKRGVAVLVDGAQAVREMPVSVRELDVDFYCFSGHKLLAPTGTGVLYAKSERLREFMTDNLGGGMVAEYANGTVIYEDFPQRLEAGTPNIAGAVALGRAMEYICETGREEIFGRERMLTAMLKDGLKRRGDVELLGQKGESGGSIVSITCGAAHPYDIAMLLDSLGIAVRAGHHCALPLHNALGLTEGSVRFSPAFYNTEQEIERAISCLDKVLQLIETGHV